MVKIEVTSEHPCQIPVLGVFEAGETKVIDEATQKLFELHYGYPVLSGHYPKSVQCVATVESDEAEEAVEENEDEEA
jgi:hypothetical protein